VTSQVSLDAILAKDVGTSEKKISFYLPFYATICPKKQTS
jgi:hypothetical protein